MKIFFAAIVSLLLIPLCGFSQITLEKQLLLNNRVELSVPVGFISMSATDIEQKYGKQAQQPNVILTDNKGEVNILVVLLNQHLLPSQVGAFKDFQMGTLKKAHPEAEWLDNGVKPINGKDVGYFKFITNASDQKVFNYYFFTDLDGKALLFTFNCTEQLLPKWKDAAESIVASLKVK